MRRVFNSTFLHISILLAATSLFTACNDNSNISATPTPPANRQPTIAGTPGTSLFVGGQYNFVPTASDSDNNRLRFSITGQPAWTRFDTRTGMLHGIPGTADVGSSENIIISVSDGTEMASLAPFVIMVQEIDPVPVPHGLDSRPGNQTCLAVAPPATAEITLERVFPNLAVYPLTTLTQAPNDSTSWYFTTRDGLI